MYRNNKIPAAIFTGILIFNFGILLWYLFSGYKAFFHSDSAVKVLLAKEIYDSGNFFPKNWNFVNGDLFLLFGHALIVPLLYFIEPGFTAHAISGMVAALIMFWGLFLLLRSIGIGVTGRLLIIASVCAGFSGFLAENLYGQVSYGVTISITLFILLLIFKILFDVSTDRGVLTSSVLFFVLLSLAIMSNPVRGVVTYIAPLFVSLFVYWYLVPESIDRRRKVFRIYLLLIVSVPAIMFAFLGHSVLLDRVNNVKGAGTALWLSYEQSMANLWLVGKGFLAMLGAAQTPGGKVTSVFGIFEALRLLAAIATLILIPLAILKLFRTGNDKVKFLMGYVIASFVTVMFVQIFTTVPVMTDPVMSSRYLVPSIFFFIIIVYIRPMIDSNNKIITFVTYGLICISSFMAYPVFANSNLDSAIYFDGSNERARRADLVAFLEQNDLRYGYGGYWNAGRFSVLSSGRVVIRQIVLDQGLPMPMRHLSSDAWYFPQSWIGKTFLLLTPDERRLIDWKALEQRGLVVKQELHRQGFDIYVFDENIANKLSGWDLTFDKETEFKASAHSLKNIGKLLRLSKTGEEALVSEKGEVGALHFGPYVRVAPGKYSVKFNIESFANSYSVAKIDVATSSGQKILAMRELNTSRGDSEELTFNIDRTETVEFRLWSLGGERIVLKGVSIHSVK